MPESYDAAAEYYLDSSRDRENSDLRTATAALSSSGLSKLRPAAVQSLKGLSGDAWSRKLSELVSTVKGESYSRAPATSSLLIDHTGADSLGGRAINQDDPESFGSSSGSYFSANPPPTAANAKRAQADALASNQQLFNIARTADGAVYGSKAYTQGVGRPKPAHKDKVLDKFAMDAEEMRHTIAQLRKQSAALKVDLGTFHREVDLLDAHLSAQTAALDEAALKKGFLRVGLPEKPRYEKVVSGSAAAGSEKLSLEEQHLTLQVQNKSLRAQKQQLEREYAHLQDDVGSLSATAEADQELERETRRRLLQEVHELQTQMRVERATHEEEQRRQDARIAELRHTAGGIQALLEVQRQNLTGSTVALQQQIDAKTALQAKIDAMQRRLARHGQH